ncbi:MAG TPA: mechanosensitive ion channel family protein [Thermoanaerobaculia bacterium]|nr:mechanosensitive ion channel family protein [Thermoanaerobaculia bacterium]
MRVRRSSLALLLLAVLASVTASLGQTPAAPSPPPPTSAASAAPAPTAVDQEQAPAVAVVAIAAPTRSAQFEQKLPAPLRREGFLDLRIWQWLALPVLLLIALVLATFATIAVRRVLRPAVERTETTIDDNFLKRVRGPLLLAFTIMFFAAGLPVLALAEPVHVFLRGLLKGLGVVALSWAALRLIDLFCFGLSHRFDREGRRRLGALVPLGRRTAKIFLSAIAVVVLLQNVGLDVTGLIAGLGIGGIAVALAAQKTIENIFGGIAVITDQPVNVGDLCRFRDGATGVIEEIGLRSTRIRTPERSLVTIPNADFSQRELENLAARDRIRLFTVIGLRYETTPDQLRAVLEGLRQLVGGHPRVHEGTVHIYFIRFGPSSLDVEISAYVKTTDQDDFNAVREEIFLRMIDTIERCGTGLARPVNLATVATNAAATPPVSANDPRPS